MAFSMLAVNGLAEDTGIERIDLPFMHWAASKAGPGATNSGFLV